MDVDDAVVELVELEAVLLGEHGPFQLTATGAAPTRTPTYEEWAEATLWCQRVEQASPWWVGDLLAYGDAAFAHQASQILGEETELSQKTLWNAKYTSEHVAPERRRATVSHSHHHEVASLPPVEQVQWLQKCEDEGLTREELRMHLRAHKAQADGVPLALWVLVGAFSVDDQQALAERMKNEGRSAQLRSKEG